MGNGRCVICGFLFDVKFPRNFPKSLRFCCACLNIAETIIKVGVKRIIGFHESLWSEGTALSLRKLSEYKRRVEIIYELITLVD